MTKKRLKLIIVLISITLLGLVSYQAYWINHSINISRELFRQDVHNALNVVAKRLETQEVLFTATKKMEVDQGDFTVIGMDSIRFISKNPLANKDEKIFITDEAINAIFLKQDTINLSDPHFGFNLNLSNELNPSTSGRLVDEDVKIEIKRTKSRIDSVQSDGINSQIKKVQEKTQMVTVVLNELLSKERNIDQRTNKEQLDTLLQQALYDMGIVTEFNYGVFDETSKEWLYAKDESMKKELLNSEFSTRLFKSDVIPRPSYLRVHFPNEQTFLLGKIWVSLASSALFIVVIILLFGYAIYAIIKQKKIDEVKNDFINNMTHEFKTPISTVSLACEALQDDDVNQSQKLVKRYLGVIRQENSRLATQVEKVLQMASLDKKDISLKNEPLQMHEIIDKAMQNVRLQVDKKEGEINYIPKAYNDQFLGDEVHMTNIIYNLLDNANKYSADSPKITLSTYNHNGSLLIQVADDGIGMSKEVQHKIFDKFYRVPTGNLHNVKGFGLGLAYVKTILDMVGGTIEVKSNPGEGSIFTVTLPQYHEQA